MPKVVPGAIEALGETAAVPLTTYSRLTDWKINCPSTWSTIYGFTSFFWTASDHSRDACYVTDAPEATCTFGEAVRNEWVDSSVICVNGQPVWTPPVRMMEALMFDVRGWTRLTDDRREHNWPGGLPIGAESARESLGQPGPAVRFARHNPGLTSQPLLFGRLPHRHRRAGIHSA